MKILALPKLRESAISKINGYFNGLAIANAHRDAAHKAKREVAANVIAGANLPDDHPFAKEASLRGLSIEEHARDVVDRPDNVQAREFDRQRTLLAVDQANSPAELDAITQGFHR